MLPPSTPFPGLSPATMNGPPLPLLWVGKFAVFPGPLEQPAANPVRRRRHPNSPQTPLPRPRSATLPSSACSAVPSHRLPQFPLPHQARSAHHLRSDHGSCPPVGHSPGSRGLTSPVPQCLVALYSTTPPDSQPCSLTQSDPLTPSYPALLSAEARTGTGTQTTTATRYS